MLATLSMMLMGCAQTVADKPQVESTSTMPENYQPKVWVTTAGEPVSAAEIETAAQQCRLQEAAFRVANPVSEHDFHEALQILQKGGSCMKALGYILVDVKPAD
ncbi:hypothetical protein VST7929_03147 [Vibrio stylophorae]|uniref:Lipoprotein n=2 Tax=Vibrio stylophorae TaxID=659351 RepID=A0ABM8ZXW1_9VIBR|nr:hypothetical protein VST7929_03147 [Vibrio stylophorae]